MSAFPGPANPVFYAQFNIRGGWKNTLAVAAGYALLVGGAMWLTAHASSVLRMVAGMLVREDCRPTRGTKGQK